MLLLNVFLALAWAAITGVLTVSNLMVGFIVGYAVLWFVHWPRTESPYFDKVGQVTRFAIFFFWELILATLRVALDIVTPRHLMKPAILAIPVNSKSDVQTTTLANVITLTPGSLSLNVSDDGRTLYVHVMYVDDVEETRQAIRNGFGKRVEEIFE